MSKIKVTDEEIRRLVRSVINGVVTTLPKEGPPITTQKRQIKEAPGDDEKFPDPKTLRRRSGRPGHRSLRSTYDEKQMDLAPLEKIAPESGVKVPGTEAYLERPLAGPSGVRLELEKALDKIRLAGPPEEGGSPELVEKMINNIMKYYKAELQKPLSTVRSMINQYKKKLISTGNLDQEDINYLQTAPGADAAVYMLDGFQSELTRMPLDVKHRATFMQLAKHGVMNLDDPNADKVLFYDNGFRTFLGREKYWDWVRDAAEAAGKYKGQF